MVRVAPSSLNRLRHLARTETFVALMWMVVLLAIETGGRDAEHDVHDAVGIAALFALVGFTWSMHRRRGLRWVRSGWRRFRKGFAALRDRGITVGVDFRLEPALPRRFPPIFLTALAGVFATLVATVGGCLLFRGDARTVIAGVSTAAWVMLLATFWLGLLVASLVLLFFPLALLHDVVHAKTATRRREVRRKAARFVTSTYVILIIVASVVVPPVWAIGGILLAATVSTAGLLGHRRSPLEFCWRTRRGGDVYAVSWIPLLLWDTWLIAMLLVVPVLWARGDLLLGAEETMTPVTALLGRIFAWTGFGAYLGWCALHATLSIRSIFANPSRPRRPVVHIETRSDEATRRRWRDRLSRVELDVSFRDRREVTDVPVRIGPAAQEGPSGFELETTFEWPDDISAAFAASTWPMTVSDGDLDSPSVVSRIKRRDHVQSRRHLLRGLERLFKKAAGRTFHKGEGYWVAPHHWFVEGLGRDEDEDHLEEHGPWFDRIIGPPYRTVMPITARAHFCEVMKALELDLVFVEDGIAFRRLKRVIRLLFETYDMFGGERRAEELHFSGLPGVRVVIHDFALDNAFESKHYPEPDYEDVGRARILHVFKDRGDEESPIEAPTEFDFAPAPAPVGVGSGVE